ncbi:CobW family GTP-binding protein [Thalassotalea euphylliae]|uniref:GTP-binding protein n=1 Tax=Thalassotalea euphylliae TaxID=1655234 RepID=A0A3E0U6M3_9GAMM|nr:GTP-binding protein [Thalassotalea euphylliae]REL32237.1 GTP-binding protein [Thalassotalea euphylliae]
MTQKNDKILAVPTNIITGFLGVGKTSAIMHLLNEKPSHERWAILVNEFGEIGVDGSLFQGSSAADQQVFIKEVPGGCMCCASGLPMQIALNLLLAEAKPDRLLIEPTGLGHPVEVLQLLSNNYYSEILDLQKTVTLVDARNLADRRYTEHATFNQQIAIADIVVGNKVDLYSDVHQQALASYISNQQIQGCPAQQLLFAEHGKIELSWLSGKTDHVPVVHRHHHHEKASAAPIVAEQPMPTSGYLKAANQGEGFSSVGWRFAPDKVFDRAKLVALLARISAERIKAVFITSDGIFGYNSTRDGLTEAMLDECLESRIEIICDEDKVEESAWEQALKQALIDEARS